MNDVVIFGRPTKEIELKYTTNNIEYVDFSIASNQRTSEKEETLYLKCKAYKGYARVLANLLLPKGRVLLTGKLKNNNYTNKDGIKIYETYLYITSVNIIDFTDKNKNNTAEEEINMIEEYINPFKEI